MSDVALRNSRKRVVNQQNGLVLEDITERVFACSPGLVVERITGGVATLNPRLIDITPAGVKDLRLMRMDNTCAIHAFTDARKKK